MEPYTGEALVAELVAAFLCGFAGFSTVTREAEATQDIQGWSQALRNDPRLIVQAASVAQRAADYIRGKVTAESYAAAA